MNDSDIIELFLTRNERAIEETSTKYGSYCFTIANQILKNQEDSEECVNDTWLKIWNAIPPQHPARLSLFLAKITRNLSFDKYKAKTAQKRGGGEFQLVLEELEECLPSSSNVEHEYQAKELGRAMNQFLRSLPERDCGIFLRRYFYVEAVPQIAKKYQIKQGNVLLILSRTRKKLLQYLKQSDYL